MIRRTLTVKLNHCVRMHLGEFWRWPLQLMHPIKILRGKHDGGGVRNSDSLSNSAMEV
jgi:hypothetical protein